MSLVMGGNLLVAWVRVAAISSPIIVIIRAASLAVFDMVSWGVLDGNIEDEISRPAIMLPAARRRMGFTIFGFSLMGFVVVSRLGFNRVK